MADESQAAPIDVEGALEVALGDEDFFKELLQLYVSETAPAIVRLADAVRAGEAETIMRIAHSLKSASGNLRAAQMQALAARLEMMGRDHSLQDASTVFQALESEFGRVRVFATPYIS
jgi:two-component system, sensor histidine kinase and response regulator